MGGLRPLGVKRIGSRSSTEASLSGHLREGREAWNEVAKVSRAN